MKNGFGPSELKLLTKILATHVSVPFTLHIKLSEDQVVDDSLVVLLQTIKHPKMEQLLLDFGHYKLKTKDVSNLSMMLNSQKMKLSHNLLQFEFMNR
jgi:predicted transcriptional regulator